MTATLRGMIRIAVVATIVLWSAIGHANNVSTLIDNLANGSERERIAAAVNLTKLGDPKAILPMAKAVLESNESSEDVRQTAAAGLGTLVTASTGSSVKKLVLKNLELAASNDPSSAVKSAAQKSISALGGTAPTGPVNSTATTVANAKAVYVNVGPMASKAAAASAQLPKLMSQKATATLGKTSYAVTWPGGPPTAAQLQAKSTAGFYVNGTLNEVDVKISGSNSAISCKVSMLLADFPSQSIIGTLNGKASIETGSSKKDVDAGTEYCVQAVVDNLITKQIIPTIKSRSGIAP